MTEQKLVSFNPDDFTAGGLLDDITVKLNHTFVLYDFEGKSTSGEAEPCLKIELTDIDTGEDYQPQYLGAGKASAWLPSEDGKSLVPVGDKAALVKSSNLAIYFTEMINAGFPKNKLTTSISCLDGIVAHMVRKELPARSGVKSTKTGKDGKEYAKTILVPDRIVSLPGEKGAAKGKTAAKTTTAAATNVDVTEAANQFVIGLLAEKGGKFQKKDIPQAIMKVDKEIRPELLKLVYANDNFLASGGNGMWTYANGEVSMAS
jgi:hypothetical protein